MGIVRTFSVGVEPEIVIRRVGGDLSISGWDRNEIHVRVDGRDESAIEQRGDSVTIGADQDCAIQEPL